MPFVCTMNINGSTGVSRYTLMPPRSGGILALAAAKRRHVKHVKRTCPRGRYTLHFCLSQLLMFSLFDLQELCHDEDKLRNFLTKYGVLARAPTCHCGKPLKPKWFYDRGSAYRYCSSRACNRKIYGKSNGILEGSKLSLKQWTHLAYFWAHNSGGVRAEHMSMNRWCLGSPENLPQSSWWHPLGASRE